MQLIDVTAPLIIPVDVDVQIIGLPLKLETEATHSRGSLEEFLMTNRVSIYVFYLLFYSFQKINEAKIMASNYFQRVYTNVNLSFNMPVIIEDSKEYARSLLLII